MVARAEAEPASTTAPAATVAILTILEDVGVEERRKG